MKWEKKGLIFCPEDRYDWMRTHAAVPFAEKKEGDIFRIYFSSRDHKNRSRIGSIDVDIANPHDIIHISDSPLLSLGPLGAFDESGVMLSWVVCYRQSRYLYYVGWNLGATVPFRNSIGLAICEGGGFKKYAAGPILDRGVNEPYFVASCCVLVEDGLWRMWYLSCIGWKIVNDRPRHWYHIKYAESSDGIHWKNDGVVCIDFKNEQEYAISRPCVLKDGECYKMWYSCRGTSYRIGYAESFDGIRWTRMDERVGIDVSESGWDSEMIEYPFVFDHGGQRYMLYNGNGYGKSGIGLAVLVEDNRGDCRSARHS